jgi:hypothetical protein
MSTDAIEQASSQDRAPISAHIAGCRDIALALGAYRRGERATFGEAGMRREVFLLVALVVVAVTLWAVYNYSAEATNIGDAIDLAKKVIGYAVFALGLGTLTAQASSQGITNLKVDDVAGGASLSVIGAILLV